MADLALIVQNMLRDEMVDYDRAERIAVAVEQAVRERIAADIEALTGRDPLADYGLGHAIRAVRGGDPS